VALSHSTFEPVSITSLLETLARAQASCANFGRVFFDSPMGRGYVIDNARTGRFRQDIGEPLDP